MSGELKFGVSVCSATHQEPTNSHLCVCGKRGGHVGEHQCYLCGHGWIYREAAAVEPATVPAAVAGMLAEVAAIRAAAGVPVTTADAKPACRNCGYFVAAKPQKGGDGEMVEMGGECARYPARVSVGPDGWCGEWRARP